MRELKASGHVVAREELLKGRFHRVTYFVFDEPVGDLTEIDADLSVEVAFPPPPAIDAEPLTQPCPQNRDKVRYGVERRGRRSLIVGGLAWETEAVPRVCLPEKINMLEKMLRGLRHALCGVRAGYQKITAEDDAFAQTPDSISLESPAFADGGDIPDRFTADGERIAPPLTWRGVPEDAASLVLVVEDPDAPIAEPLVHLLAWDLPPDVTSIDEGLFRSPNHDGLDENLGRNSFLQTAYPAHRLL